MKFYSKYTYTHIKAVNHKLQTEYQYKRKMRKPNRQSILDPQFRDLCTTASLHHSN